MNESNSNPGSSMPGPQFHDWRAERRAERLARREARWHGSGRGYFGWYAGGILILMGVIFLLQNLNIAFLRNWWALFFLLPAFWMFVAAWEGGHGLGRMTRRTAGYLTAGILLVVLSFIFLFNLAIGIFWPAVLILGGIALLGSALLPD